MKMLQDSYLRSLWLTFCGHLSRSGYQYSLLKSLQPLTNSEHFRSNKNSQKIKQLWDLKMKQLK